MHISHLRKKLGHRAGEVERIKTVRGVGYVYANDVNRKSVKAVNGES
jgi:DNA-binding response OmpR family regulator